MKTAILYCSKYRQQTKMIAEAMGSHINADLYSINEASNLDIRFYDLIGFGSGVYQETLPSNLLQWVGQKNLVGKNVFVFSTSGMGWKLYNKTLVKLLEEKKANVIGNFACKGSFTASEFSTVKMFDVLAYFAKNHPNERDKKRARRFIDQMVEKIIKA